MVLAFEIKRVRTSEGAALPFGARTLFLFYDIDHLVCLDLFQTLDTYKVKTSKRSP